MTRIRHSLVLALAGFAPIGVALGDSEPDVPITDQAIIVLQPGSAIQDFNAVYGTTLLVAVPEHDLYLVQLPAWMGPEDLEDLVENDQSVQSADPHYTGRDVDPQPGTQSIFFASTYGSYIDQPALLLIGVASAQSSALGWGIVVAVIDSGVDAANPELAGALIGPGFNFIDGNSDTADVGDGIDSDGDGAVDEMVGHGTLVAGLIHRVAPEAKLLPLKILDSDGLTTTFRLSQAIYYAVDHGADIINISLGTTDDPDVLQNAIDYATSSGALVVAAVGNEGVAEPVRYPSGHSGSSVFAVAAVGQGDILAPFSNFGPHVSISAPGVNITSTTPGGGYGAASGTSFAAPLVAGTLALLRSGCAQTTLEAIGNALLSRAVPIDAVNPGYEGMIGAGRLDAAAAVGACHGDLDGNGTIGVTDLLLLLASWGGCPPPPQSCPADLDGDGGVGVTDLLILLASWG